MTTLNLSARKQEVVDYVESGIYLSEDQSHINDAINYLYSSIIKPESTIIIDVDDTAIDLYSYWKNITGFGDGDWDINHSYLVTDAPAKAPVLELFNKSINFFGINIIFLTARRETRLIDNINYNLRDLTVKLLDNAGYKGYSNLIMRATDDTRSDRIYKQETIKELQSQGYDILVNIGDQQTDFEDGQSYFKCKLENPFYDLTFYEKKRHI